MITVRTVDYDQRVSEIGVLADTHIPTRSRSLPSAVLKAMEGVDLILHAGDFVDNSVFDELSAIAPVEGVAGNMDPYSLQRRLGKVKLIRIGKLAIGLQHGDLVGRRVDYAGLREIFGPVTPDVIVFGHIHRPVSEVVEGILYFNPGSAVDPRRVDRPSCGKLWIDGDRVQAEFIVL